MSKNNNSSAISIFVEALQDKDIKRNDRIQAAEFLGEIRSNEALTALRVALKDKDYAIRRIAAISLAREQREEAIPELIKALHHYYPESDSRSDVKSTFLLDNDTEFIIEGMTREDLRSLGERDAIQAWIWEHKNISIRESVAKALGNFNKNKFIIDKLFCILDKGLKSAAIPLGKQGNSKVIPILLELLRNPSETSFKIHEIADALAHLVSTGYTFIIDRLFENLDNINSGIPSDPYFRNRIIVVFIKVLNIKPKIMPEYLPNFINLLSTEVGEQALWAISEIQANCKFYNYDIFRSPPIRESKAQNSNHLLARIDRTTQQIDRRTQQMADQPKNDFSGANFSGPVNFGDRPTGDFIGTQHNYTTSPQLESALQELKTTLAELQQQHPNVTTESEAIEVIDGELTNPFPSRISSKLAPLFQQFRNPERHFQATKATLSEVAKHFFTESIWAKALITYIDTFSSDPGQGA